MSTRFENVVIFGDSLSDIGIKVKTASGWMGKNFSDMTTNPTGRFSDCRNWTDHMYEDATGGQTLMKASLKDTLAASENHQSFHDGGKWKHATNWFRYANYAEGGACGDTPYDSVMKRFLGTFKDQVKSFRKDYAKIAKNGIGQDEKFLFFVWFGANDLYTADRPANEMATVGEVVGKTMRQEVASIVAPHNATFVMMNLGLPLSSTRYQKLLDEAKRKTEKAQLASQSRTGPRGISAVTSAVKERKKNKAEDAFKKAYNEVKDLEHGARTYNGALKLATIGTGDLYVDIRKVIAPEALSGLKHKLNLKQGSQRQGASAVYRSKDEYEKVWNQSVNGAFAHQVHISTSDDAHPTDRVYKLMWQTIKAQVLQKGYTFGMLP